MSASDDEFAYFLDPCAAGIDLDSIPELSAIPPPSQSSIQTLSDSPAPAPAPAEVAGSRFSTPLATREDFNAQSSQYSFEEVDAAFLAEVDKAEQRLLQFPNADRQEGPSTHSNPGCELTSRYFHGLHAEDPQPGNFDGDVKGTNSNAEGSRGDLSSSIPEPKVKSTKEVHELSSPPSEGPSHKRPKEKQKESPRKMLKEYLNNFEDEMICSICCDIFAFAHLGNPCGHTFCGECGWRWIRKNEAPSCAICRANLSVDAPMIPNFAVDSAVEKHVQALGTNGVDGWETDGSKFSEWQARKERWKTNPTRLMMAKKSTVMNPSVVVASYAFQGNFLGGPGDELDAVSSSDESRSSEEIRLPSTSNRRVQRRVSDHQRRTGVHRRGRGRTDSRGGTTRGRRPRRRRRDH